MQETPRLVLVLTVAAAVAGLLVAVAESVTREPIRQAKAAAFAAALRDVLPSGVPDPVPQALLADDGATNRILHVAGDAMAIEVQSANGYSGPIRLLVGFSGAGMVHDYRVLEHRETPGLGAHIVGRLRAAITNRPADATVWKVRKDGGDIDAITAATISSRAVCEAIAEAVALRAAALRQRGVTPP